MEKYKDQEKLALKEEEKWGIDIHEELMNVLDGKDLSF